MSSETENQAGNFQDMKEVLVLDTDNKTGKLSVKCKVLAATGIALGTLLVTALVVVVVVVCTQHQQSKSPVWFKHNTVIHSVITSKANGTQEQAQARRKRSADSNNTSSDWLNSTTVEMTSIILSVSKSEVKILVLPGWTSVDAFFNETVTAGNETAQSEADQFPMLVVTANPSTGDIQSVECSHNASDSDSSQFVNTGLLVVQQLLVDTTAIESAYSITRDDNVNCDRSKSYGTTEYCKTTQHVNDKASAHLVYRKQYSNRPKASTSRGVEENSKVNVQVDSYVSKDSGLLKKGSLKAAATLNVFTHESESKTIELSHDFHTDFSVDPNGISSNQLKLLNDFLATVKLVKCDQLTTTPTWASNSTGASNNGTSLQRAKRNIHPHVDFELFRLFGESVRAVADVSVTCCSAVGDFSLYVGPRRFDIVHKEVGCSDVSYSNTLVLAAYSEQFVLAVFPTPVGPITIHLAMNYKAEIYSGVTASATAVVGTVRPQASAGMAVNGDWNFAVGEVGAGASVNAGVQFPMQVTLNLEKCDVSSSGKLVYNADGKVGLYYKIITTGEKCWKVWRHRICIPWPTMSGEHYIISEGVSVGRSITIW